MTDAEWAQQKAAVEAWKSLLRKAGERKMLLYCCACCRRIWESIPYEPAKAAVAAIERFALDGCLRRPIIPRDALKSCTPDSLCGGSPAQYAIFCLLMYWFYDDIDLVSVVEKVQGAAADAARLASAGITDVPRFGCFGHEKREAFRKAVEAVAEPESVEITQQRGIFRDIFGTRLRAVNRDLSWVQPAVVDFAKNMYEDLSLDRMPHLAVILKGANCNNMDILRHCLTPGPHVAGCWAIDLILGRD
jgi:hypothetical protein